MQDLFDHDQAELLIDKIDPKYKPVWQSRPRKDQLALARYFLPHRSTKPIIGPTRPRIIKWYCPFACQKIFASGHRYCINVYTGCAHNCVYCYAAGYSPDTVNPKKSFEKLLAKDMADLEAFDVPAAPVHLSNSTDPFQPLEEQLGHTRLALEYILRHRRRFTTVIILTKNPLLASQAKYLNLFQQLNNNSNGHPGCIIEASLAFWQEEAKNTFDPDAPTIAERIEGIRRLRNAGVPVALRIDPLFPRSPITKSKTMSDFGLPEPQTLDDLKAIVDFAKEVQVQHIIYSVARIVQPRYRKMSDVMQKMKAVYQAYAEHQKLLWQGGSHRLPTQIAQQKILNPFLQLCTQNNLPAKYCRQNLIMTR